MKFWKRKYSKQKNVKWQKRAARRARNNYLTVAAHVGSTLVFWILVYGGAYYVCSPALNVSDIMCIQVTKLGLASEIGRLTWAMGGTVTINTIVSWLDGGRATEVIVEGEDF